MCSVVCACTCGSVYVCFMEMFYKKSNWSAPLHNVAPVRFVRSITQAICLPSRFGCYKVSGWLLIVVCLRVSILNQHYFSVSLLWLSVNSFCVCVRSRVWICAFHTFVFVCMTHSKTGLECLMLSDIGKISEFCLNTQCGFSPFEYDEHLQQLFHSRCSACSGQQVWRLNLRCLSFPSLALRVSILTFYHFLRVPVCLCTGVYVYWCVFCVLVCVYLCVRLCVFACVCSCNFACVGMC